MAEVRPFRGVRYDNGLAGGLERLLCPPYDVISPEEQQALLGRSPYNMVRLELAREQPPEDEVYRQAGVIFRQWREIGVLGRDRAPAMYVVRQSFTHGAGVRERLTILACVRLEPFGTSVLPHERTSEGPKRDRLALMEASGANFSPLMALYRDSTGRLSSFLQEVLSHSPDDGCSLPDGQELALWVSQDPALTDMVTEALAGSPLYLADGHHRYETALWYRQRVRSMAILSAETGTEAYSFVMMGLISLDDPGLLVLPYHRLVGRLAPPAFTRLRERLREVFRLEATTATGPEGLAAEVEERSRKAMTLGLLGPGGEGPYLLVLQDPAQVRRLAPSGPAQVLAGVAPWVLHEAVLRPVLGEAVEEHVSYVHDAAEVWQRSRTAKAQLAFLLPGLSPILFEAVVAAGQRLPPKSTYFHPKLPSGLVINPLDGML
ncbi:MAG: DUF1015 domain-containing protein [Chloroflexi bacterium]|nr:DUF1015 domain-containing protein [Chloroflexota bacterium]